jgi:primosomal replication protein N
MNRLLLSARLLERGVMRYTPAGLPALELSLKHESELSEDGHPRKVQVEVRSLAIGSVTKALVAMALGSAGLFSGFVAASRNGRGLLFHITSVEPMA